MKHPPGAPPPADARSTLITLRFSVARLVEEHGRCRDAAEYVARIASAGRPDAAMDAREISAALFELLEAIHAQGGEGEVELEVARGPSGVDIVAAIPAEGPQAARVAGWVNASRSRADRYLADVRSRLDNPGAGDGLAELVAAHGVTLSLDSARPLVVRMAIPLEGGADA